MTNAQEKRIGRFAERNGFRLERVGSGKGHGRFYILNPTEVQRMRSGVLDHEYFFTREFVAKLAKISFWCRTRRKSRFQEARAWPLPASFAGRGRGVACHALEMTPHLFLLRHLAPRFLSGTVGGRVPLAI